MAERVISKVSRDAEDAGKLILQLIGFLVLGAFLLIQGHIDFHGLGTFWSSVLSIVSLLLYEWLVDAIYKSGRTANDSDQS